MKKERVKESQSQRREGFFCNQREAESAMHRGIPESVKLNLAKMRIMPVFARIAQLFKS